MNKATLIFVLFLSLALQNRQAPADELPEIRIVKSSTEMIQIYKDLDYWGALQPEKIIEVPPLLVVVTKKEWSSEAAKLTVEDKKELFYRSLLPLILYGNEVIALERKRLQAIIISNDPGILPVGEDADWLFDLAVRYKLANPENAGSDPLPGGEKLVSLLEELLIRVDIIPASLALGQGAYESGYGTSRFALEGNSYFGQWTYGGKGMTPLEKRASKGDYGVAAYAWPLDAVRSYMMNLNTHRAYAGLRDKRSQLRESGQPVTGLSLAQTLDKYSERGEAYVKTLTGMMRVNELDAADDARLREEPLVLIIDANGEENASEISQEIADLRASGELHELVHSMGIAEIRQ